MGYGGNVELIQQWADVMVLPERLKCLPHQLGPLKRICYHSFHIVPVMRGYGQFRASGR